jgi:hypothetical protein
MSAVIVSVMPCILIGSGEPTPHCTLFVEVMEQEKLIPTFLLRDYSTDHQGYPVGWLSKADLNTIAGNGGLCYDEDNGTYCTFIHIYAAERHGYGNSERGGLPETSPDL